MQYLADLFWLLLIIPATLMLPLFFLEKGDKYIPSLRKLLLYHLIFGVFYFILTNNGGGDAWYYWAVVKKMDDEKFLHLLFTGDGTNFMEALNYIPSNFLGMSFFSNTIFFSFIGCIGVCCFYVVALQSVPYNKLFWQTPLFPLIFFLPNLHFWSSGIGKDTLLFTSIGLIVFGLMNPIRRWFPIIIGFLTCILIRPHIGFLFLVAFGIAYVFGGKIKPFQRLFFLGIFIIGALVMIPYVQAFIGVDNFSTETLAARSALQQKYLSEGSGSTVDIKSYPFPAKVFTFLYRPLFFDVRSFGSLLSSFDNLILLFLTIVALKYKPLETFKNAPFVVKGFLIFGILGTLVFSTSLSNLGIMVRMKNMFTPGILIYFMWCYSYRLYTEKWVPEQLKKINAKRKEKSSSDIDIINP